MSRYIASGEYDTYGLAAGSNTDRAVTAASALIDGHLRRPEGLVWSPDFAGLPCFMAGAVPIQSWKIQADIEPGSNVTVSLDSAPSATILGEAMVLDAPTPDHCETVVVTAIDGANVTFGTVGHVHSVTSPLDLGLVISERKLVGYQCPAAFLSRGPVARVVAVGSRWDASSRREPSLSDPQHGYIGFSTGIGVVPQSAPPQWNLLDPSLVDCDPGTGKLLVHAVSARSEVRACYLAGWPSTGLPDIVKQICARVAQTILQQDPHMPLDAKLYKAGDTAIQRFANTMIDDDMRVQLIPFAAKRGL